MKQITVYLIHCRKDIYIFLSLPRLFPHTQNLGVLIYLFILRFFILFFAIQDLLPSPQIIWFLMKLGNSAWRCPVFVSGWVSYFPLVQRAVPVSKTFLAPWLPLHTHFTRARLARSLYIISGLTKAPGTFPEAALWKHISYTEERKESRDGLSFL